MSGVLKRLLFSLQSRSSLSKFHESEESDTNSDGENSFDDDENLSDMTDSED